MKTSMKIATLALLSALATPVMATQHTGPQLEVLAQKDAYTLAAMDGVKSEGYDINKFSYTVELSTSRQSASVTATDAASHLALQFNCWQDDDGHHCTFASAMGTAY